jgi:hypothetical protein
MLNFSNKKMCKGTVSFGKNIIYIIENSFALWLYILAPAVYKKNLIFTCYGSLCGGTMLMFWY